MNDKLRWHKVILALDRNPNQRAAKIQFCKDNFGNRWRPLDDMSGTWDVHWAGYDNAADLYIWKFKNEEDAMMFKLRWS